MHLYNVTLQQPSALTHSLAGNFSGSKQQEICVVRGQSILELFRVDPNSGKMHSFHSHQCFGLIRSIVTVRLTGGIKDFICVGSDSGQFVILEYSPDSNAFVRVHQEPYGKSGCRRLTPGQFMAADPRGRAVMLAAVEKQKLVYVLNRDAENRLTISSPLEAHKSHTITFDVKALDVAFENPLFAAIEYDYVDFDRSVEDAEPEPPVKMLTLYELDLGLNHVVRKWSQPTQPSANILIPLPGGKEGPGGVLVCSELNLTWNMMGQESVSVHFPTRDDSPAAHRSLIVSYATHKMKNFFFVLAQSEDGDLFKITVDWEDQMVQAIHVKYFDTIPVSLSLSILKSGFLFSCAEAGSNYFYQIESLGDDDDEQMFSSDSMDDDAERRFHPRALRNLSAVDELTSYNPNIQSMVLNITGDDAPQIYSICGAGVNSSFKILRHGLEVSELVSYPLPANPTAIFSLKADLESEYHSYIVISFINATLVLSVGETVEEVSESGFRLDTQTLNCHQMGSSSLIQIHANGVLHIRSDGTTNEWSAPRASKITHSACNNRQLCIALDARKLVYFELDELENLNEYEDHRSMTAEVKCLAIGTVPEGKLRSRFLAIGCADSTVRIASLNPETTLDSVGMQAVNNVPSSLMFVEFLDADRNRNLTTLYLNVGLESGVLVRTVMDSLTGALSDSRSRYLGSRPVKLFPVSVEGESAVLCLSSKPWLNYVRQSKVYLEPMSYDMLEYGASFMSEQCPEGILAIAENTMRILTLDNVEQLFHTVSIPLQHTPRCFVYETSHGKFVIIEGDHRSSSSQKITAPINENGEDEDNGHNFLIQTRAGKGQWSSGIRLLNPLTGDSEQFLRLEDNEMVTCLTSCRFHQCPGIVHYAVGVAVDMTLQPPSCSSGYIAIYRADVNGILEFVHKTQVDGRPTALCQFQGRLLAGMGKTLRIFDLGLKKLLRKSETSAIPNMIT
eukprot:Partr_v1_DN28525_c1_g1_i1_m73348 putative Splicing factor 3b subunit